MPSLIDPTKPTSDAPTVASVRENFANAKTEIETLQNTLTNIVGLTTLIAPLSNAVTALTARVAAIEANAPPPPPPPAPPTIAGLTLTAAWVTTPPTTQYTSADITVTATTDATYATGEIQIGVQAAAAWYVNGSGGDYVTLGTNASHTATVNVSLFNPDQPQTIQGSAGETQPPYTTTLCPVTSISPP